MTKSTAIPETIDPNSARIYGLVARKGRRAVLFRRGPSRQVRLLSWDLETDAIEAGQWLKARIYERRCDLSPSGNKLVYFAANYRKPLYSWTAISRPPFFTALTLWPKGDGWGGGGLFDSERRLRLNHLFGEGGNPVSPVAEDQMQISAGLRPKGFEVAPLGQHSGRGEDDPIMSARLMRDGWVIASQPQVSEHRHRASRFSWTFNPPLTMQKMHARARADLLLLRTHLQAIHERQGRWYVATADLLRNGQMAFEFGRIDWADLDHNGDVLYAKEGRVFRLPIIGSGPHGGTLVPRLIVDLNAMTFEQIETPAWARSWR